MKLIMGMVLVALLIGACGKQKPETSIATESVSALDPRFLSESLMRGARLYQQHCAQCHGPDAQGHPDWQNPKMVVAPPLNGTGNDWKRRKQDIFAVIKNGAKRGGIPVMPGWNGRLNDREIEDIIIWYQALWPADVYERWLKANDTVISPQG